MSNTIRVEISPGELIDRITILEIKSERIGDPAKLANVRDELRRLSTSRAASIPDDPEIARLSGQLKAVNAALWEIEDGLRRYERTGDFGTGFVAMARSVYRQNDRRAELKRAINQHLGSTLTEEKSYADY